MGNDAVFGTVRILLADRGCELHLLRMTDPSPITRLNAALEARYRIERELGESGNR